MAYPGSRLAAFVVTYQRPDELARTLEALLAQSCPPESVLVVDNGSSAETATLVESFASDGVGYRDAEANLGPAGGAALGLTAIVGTEADWIYWGDDDDPPRTAGTFERLLDLAAKAAPARVGGVGAAGALWNWRSGRLERLPDRALSGPLDVDNIAGGSQLLLSADAVRDVGFPEPRLFFGLEELEYCLRLRGAGYRLLVDGDLMLEYRSSARRLALPPRIALVPDAPREQLWRHYYSTRNYIFMMRRTFRRPDLARRCVLRTLAKTVTAWSRGIGYGSYHARLQLRALLDGYAGRMGRTVTAE